MSMSLDSYIAGPGDGVEPLHQWMLASGEPGTGLNGADQEVFDELRTQAGAMICGRRLYDITRGWNGSHPFAGIPVFVVTHTAPAAVPAGATPFTFVTDGITSAVARAKQAAGGKSVYVIGGASIVRQLLDAGLVDELRIDLIPVLLGGGIPLFGKLHAAPAELEQVKVTASPSHVTHLWYPDRRRRMSDTEPQTAGGKVLWHFTMSLDGFVAGPNHEMDWMSGVSFRPGLAEEFVETTGAVLGAETAGTRPPATAAPTASAGTDRSSCSLSTPRTRHRPTASRS
jgi:dihydrofolate reductase